MPNSLDDARLNAGAKVYGRKAATDAFTEALSVDSNGVLQLGVGLSGVTATGSLKLGTANVALGASAGLKINGGEAAFDGSNPTSVAHGLTSCTAVITTLKGTAAPGDNTSVITANINGANVDYYAWKNTGGTDPTLVASSGTESFYWLAIGS